MRFPPFLFLIDPFLQVGGELVQEKDLALLPVEKLLVGAVVIPEIHREHLFKALNNGFQSDLPVVKIISFPEPKDQFHQCRDGTRPFHAHPVACGRRNLRFEMALERFRAKWTPVRVKKTHRNKKLELRF